MKESLAGAYNCVNPLKFLIPIIKDRFPTLKLTIDLYFIDLSVDYDKTTDLYNVIGWISLVHSDVIRLTGITRNHPTRFEYDLYSFNVDDLLDDIGELSERWDLQPKLIQE